MNAYIKASNEKLVVVEEDFSDYGLSRFTVVKLPENITVETAIAE
jgi:hypothetical protein